MKNEKLRTVIGTCSGISFVVVAYIIMSLLIKGV